MKILIAAVFAVMVAVPANAQSFKDRVSEFIAEAATASDNLEGSFDRLEEALRTAADSGAAEAELNGLKKRLEENAQRYGTDSPIWDSHANLVEFVVGRQENAKTKLAESGDSRWETQAKRWEKNEGDLQELRVSLIAEADRSGRLAKRMETEIDLVLDMFLAEGVEAAIAELQSVRDNVKQLNDNVERALDVATQNLVADSAG